MKRSSRLSPSSLKSLALCALLLSCKHAQEPASRALAGEGGAGGVTPAEGEVLITILATNDIHGGIEPTLTDGAQVGGLAYWGGVVEAVRSTNRSEYPGRAVTLVVDAGDQFQGTLVSNFNEGRAVFEAFDRIGYDAVVPGNHDYDFGPQGWLEDVVLPITPPALADKRGALKAALVAAPLPVVSANTYLRESVGDGKVTNAGCKPQSGSSVIDWTKARRPDYVKPYVLKEESGVRVALVGLDNVKTYETTQGSNVSDLCFRDLFETFLEVRKDLEGQADAFVIVTHEGNLATSANGGFRKDLRNFLAEHQGAVDAVVTGHSHQVERYDVDGVPVIQSGSGGSRYGRIDLVFNRAQKKVDVQRTRYAAGIVLRHEEEENREVEPLAAVQAIVDSARAESATLGSRKIGSAATEIKRSRKEDSPLANALTDLLLLATGADVVFINSATIRDTLPKSLNLTYEHLFKVLPFSSRTIRLKPIGAKQLVDLAQVAVAESGEFGILCYSGFRLEYSGSGAAAKLKKVRLTDGTLLFDAATGGLKATNRQFQVLALDFIVDPISGVKVLKDLPQDKDVGVFRELVAERLFTQPVAFPKVVDGRLKKL